MNSPTEAAATEIVATANPELQMIGAILFALAVLHTFMVKRFEHIAQKYPEGSIGENFFHFLAETEVVFAIWGAGLGVSMLGTLGMEGMLQYVETRNYTEPMFVFVIMVLAATRPVLELTKGVFGAVARLLPVPEGIGFFVTTLIIGPLLGSFITEPAAMTVTALVLYDRYFSQNISKRLKYATIGLLFVSISIGGTLTHYAAPPVLMVAGTWGWDMKYMFFHFGYKSAVAVVLGTIVTAMIFQHELRAIKAPVRVDTGAMSTPVWIYVFHVLFIAITVYFAHHPTIFMWVLGMALAFFSVTREYQDELKIKESLLVGVFLAGLVTLGGMQQWWLEPILSKLGDIPLFLGATALTAITDNAALTYLGSLVPGLSDTAKYALVAGAVAGGGLTVIANAPNPAGYGILKPAFGDEGISPMGLLVAAIPYTLLAMACLWFLPHLG